MTTPTGSSHDHDHAEQAPAPAPAPAPIVGPFNDSHSKVIEWSDIVLETDSSDAYESNTPAFVVLAAAKASDGKEGAVQTRTATRGSTKFTLRAGKMTFTHAYEDSHFTAHLMPVPKSGCGCKGKKTAAEPAGGGGLDIMSILSALAPALMSMFGGGASHPIHPTPTEGPFPDAAEYAGTPAEAPQPYSGDAADAPSTP